MFVGGKRSTRSKNIIPIICCEERWFDWIRVFDLDDERRVNWVDAASTPLPTYEHGLVKPYKGITTLEQLQEALDQEAIALASIKDSEEREKASMRRCVRMCYEHFVDLHRGDLLSGPRSEGWLDVQVWSTFLDKCLYTIPKFDVLRGEICCLGSGQRRNRKRTNSEKRQRIGRRMDGIFCLRGYHQLGHELGGIESSGTDKGGPKGTKWLRDSEKLAMTLRDMMVALRQRNPSVREITLMGVICSGLTLRIYTMENPKGQVCIFRSMDSVQVPKNFNVQQVTELILEVIRLQNILAISVRFMLGCISGSATNQVESRDLLYSFDTDGGDGKL